MAMLLSYPNYFNIFIPVWFRNSNLKKNIVKATLGEQLSTVNSGAVVDVTESDHGVAN